MSSSSRYIAVGRTGTVYVTDYADGKLYAVTVGSLNVWSGSADPSVWLAIPPTGGAKLARKFDVL